MKHLKFQFHSNWLEQNTFDLEKMKQLKQNYTYMCKKITTKIIKKKENS